MQWWEIKQEAINDYCAALRRHKTPEAVIRLHRRAVTDAQDDVQRLSEAPRSSADWEWGHRLKLP